jgi:hypothetical protein
MADRIGVFLRYRLRITDWIADFADCDHGFRRLSHGLRGLWWTSRILRMGIADFANCGVLSLSLSLSVSVSLSHSAYHFEFEKQKQLPEQ